MGAVVDETSVSINLGIDVSIPKEYIQDAGQRLRTYKRIASSGGEDLDAIYREVEDRYGRIPRSVTDLFSYARLRKRAESMGLVSIDKAQGGAAIKLGESARVDAERLMAFVGNVEGSSFSPNGILRFPLDDEYKVFETIQAALDSIALV